MSATTRPVTVNATYAVALAAAAGFAVTLLISSAGWQPAYENRPLHLVGTLPLSSTEHTDGCQPPSRDAALARAG